MSEDGIKVADILEASKEMLQMQLYAVFTTPTDGLGPVMEHLKEHLEFQVELERKGIMFAAGPFWNDDGTVWQGEGMVLIRAASLDEARAIAASDPMHQCGARSFRVRPWLVNEGGMTVKVRFSDGSHEII